MTFSIEDKTFMRQALVLAARGLYTTMPNPRVGCVLVRNGQVVGEGWHLRAGEPHAEIHALRAAGEKAHGATAYVTLEPCSHHGRTPPCADALIASGVVRVVAAMRDPNPLVAGRGLTRLAAAGIEVGSGLLETEAVELNIGFVSRMVRGRPWLRVKTGCSLDGRTALLDGQSQWITSAESRSDVQQLRARSCAMLTGIGTVLLDNPQLTVRELDTGRQPLRVIVDSQLRTPADARILQTPGVLIACCGADTARSKSLQEAGAEVVVMAGNKGRVDLQALLEALSRRGCNEVTVEAGAELVGSLFKAGLVDDLVLYQAPVLIGDPARGVANLELHSLPQKLAPRVLEKTDCGPDLKWTLRFTELNTLLPQTAQ
ncbi:MAG: bifunctional diaminohydroxyphosphoribosylaminopyrimidine deaminase/5-amino-6-(5-phosphoribosylamino)uracil reductase RibD [Formivibrio sp.]|nr:bifunctional diaminohydroxyphosphoribosylaminopyrimidine deaminase/5-amino-6-(5-phosphoribosylamino)uracil reductase RibD [Formivibrio sp.]